MRKLVIIASAVSALTLAYSVAPAAEAGVHVTHRPSATFSFKNDRISHGIKPTLSYRTGNLPRRSTIYLQRQFGSRHVWKNVERLKDSHGTTKTSAVQMGKYYYRLQVREARRTIVTSRVHTLFSYAEVTLSALCPEDGFDCAPATIQVGDTIFTYVLAGNGTYPNYNTALQFNSTSCRNLSLQFATAYDTTSGDEAYVELVQSRTDPQYGSTPINTIGKFTATLDGGPFYLETAESVGWDVYMDGDASCYTPSGNP